MIERPELPKLAKRAARATGAQVDRARSISTAHSATRRSMTAPRCCRASRLDGPAVVEEFGSTTVVFPGQDLEVDPHGVLIVRRAAGRAEVKP